MPLLQVSNLQKTYRLGKVVVPVLRGASLSVEQGEFVAVLGASGSGKSTLLHLIGGLDVADRGSKSADGGARDGVAFDGRSLSAMSASELDRYRARDVGFVFQFYHLLPELSVVQNVLIASMVRHRLGFGSARAACAARASEILDAFGLGGRLRHRPAQLSGGERQRVAIARALINEPRLLLADEPTGNLDTKNAAAVFDIFARMAAEEGRSVIVVTHDPGLAARATRQVHLVDGRILYDEATAAAPG